MNVRAVADGVRLLAVGSNPEAVFRAISEGTRSYMPETEMQMARAGEIVVVEGKFARHAPEDLKRAIEAAGGTAEVIPRGSLRRT